MKRDFLTLSNLLSILRILLAIPFAAVMLSSVPSAPVWGCFLLGLGVLTDRLDGYFARRYDQETEWGRILDPLADKIGIAVVALVLLILGRIPLWFVAVIVARDLLILAGGIYLKARTGKVLPSNRLGKWAVGVIAVALFLALLDIAPAIQVVLMVTTLIMLLVSLLLYVRRLIEVLRTENA
ncbi:MAG: CDP-alcohol phosphatidyltransferase family protein [Bacteroidetes bacterium]|nr:CDP-alcohol phosphatidyltransferase family protein [Bacteroidota bacterium]